MVVGRLRQGRSADAVSQVPWSMVGTILINGASGFGMTVAMLYCMGDPMQVVEAYLDGQLPFATIFINAVGSPSGAVGLVSIYSVNARCIALSETDSRKGFIPSLVGVFGSVGVLAAASRMTWAFAREKGWCPSIRRKSACR